MTTETTAVTPQAPVNAQKSTGGFASFAIDVFVMLVVAFAAIILTLKYGPQLGIGQQASTSDGQFVVVNIESLAREEMTALGDMVRKGEIAPAEMPPLTETFSNALIKQLQSYADDTGKVILRRDSVVAAPHDTLDLTDDIRAKLIKSGAMQKPADTKEKP